MKQKSITSLVITIITLSGITASIFCMNQQTDVKKIILEISLSEPTPNKSHLSKSDKHYNRVFGLPCKASKASWFSRFDVEFYKVDAILIKSGDSYRECTTKDLPLSKVAKNQDCCNNDFNIQFPPYIHASLLEPLLATTPTNPLKLKDTQFADSTEVFVHLKELKNTSETLNKRLWTIGYVILGTAGIAVLLLKLENLYWDWYFANLKNCR